MASTELERRSETVEKVENKRSEMDTKKIRNRGKEKNKKIRKIRFSYISKFGCFRSNHDYPTVEKSDGDKSFEMESGCTGENHRPNHLIIMVNGIIGSAENWKFAAKQFVKKYPQNVIVHCSECNYSTLTFDGVDVMGKRLAAEVKSVIKCYANLQKISFIGHSLGGLVARYAIAELYELDITRSCCQERGDEDSNDLFEGEKFKGKIAGLEPMNFITSATPHLGTKGHKQVPLFCGFYTLEKVVSRTSWFLGRTGEHLFLTDSNDGKPPLLLQMVDDCDNLHFMSALQSFRRRVAYANARFDHLVGWSTSSLRRRNELPKLKRLQRNDKYPHVVNVEMAKTADSQQELPLEGKVDGFKTMDMEEAMLRGLTKVSWERVDVSFSGSKQRFFAHSTIQKLRSPKLQLSLYVSLCLSFFFLSLTPSTTTDLAVTTTRKADKMRT